MAALIIASLSRILKLSDSTSAEDPIVVEPQKRRRHDNDTYRYANNDDDETNNNNNKILRCKIKTLLQRTSATSLSNKKTQLPFFNPHSNSNHHCYNYTAKLLPSSSNSLLSKSSTNLYQSKNKQLVTKMAHLSIKNKLELDVKCKSTSALQGNSFSIEKNFEPQKDYPTIERVQQAKFMIDANNGYETPNILDGFEEGPLGLQEKLEMNEILDIGATTFDYTSEPSLSWNHHDHFIKKRTLSSSMSNLSVDQTFSKTSLCSDSGVSAMYTSTPIKNEADVENGMYNNNPIMISPVSFPGTTTTTKDSSSSSNHIVPISTISSRHLNPKKNYDESFSYILEEGDEEFRTKYSTWITQLFHLQLTKIHRRLTHEYNRKIDQITKENQNDIWDIEHRNRKTILEQQATIDKYQNLLTSLKEENKRIKKTKQVITDELEKAAIQSKQNFEAELERHVNIIQAECERDKSELNQKHAEQLKTFLDKSCSQIEKVEQDYKEQIEILSKLVNELEMRNEQLEEQVRMYKRLVESSGPNNLRLPVSSGSYCFQREKEHLLAVIQDLKNKLYDAEKDKTAVIAEYEEKLIHLNKEFDTHEKDLVKQLENSQRNFEVLHQAHENEIKKYQAKLEEQSTNSQKIIEKLREKYGEKIKTLTEMVENLQNEIVGSAINSNNSKLM